MPAGRPQIPKKLARQIRVEAGHRCAIPTCRQTPIVLAHIKPWKDARRHDFDNLIALCPTCHDRFDRGDIDRLSMMQYKANLGVLNSRFGDVERRVLSHFAQHPDAAQIEMPGGMGVLLHYLLLDGYLEYGETLRSRASPDGFSDFEVVVLQIYRLTGEGRAFVDKWANASAL